jgi:hypothetical protein
MGSWLPREGSRYEQHKAVPRTGDVMTSRRIETQGLGFRLYVHWCLKRTALRDRLRGFSRSPAGTEARQAGSEQHLLHADAGLA